MRKKKRRRLSPEERAEFVKLCVAGAPPRVLGERFGMSTCAACNLRARLGHSPNATTEVRTAAIIRRVRKSLGDGLVNKYPHLIANACQQEFLPADAPVEVRAQFYMNTLAAIRGKKCARPTQPEENREWIN